MTECWSELLRPVTGRLLRILQPYLMQEQDEVCFRELFICLIQYGYNLTPGYFKENDNFSSKSRRRRLATLRFCYRKLHCIWGFFSYETKIVFSLNHKVYVWRPSDERMFGSPRWLGNLLPCISDVLGMYFLLWLGTLVPVEGNMNTERHISVLDDSLFACQAFFQSPVDVSGR